MLRKLKNYHGYLSQTQNIPNITHLIKIHGTQQKRLRPLLTEEQLHELTEAYYHQIQQHQPSPQALRRYPDHPRLLQRQYLALSLVCSQALAIHELEALSPAHFDLHKATIRLRASRRAAARTLPLQAYQIPALIAYLQDPATPGQEDSTALLPNRTRYDQLCKSLKGLHPKYLDLRQLRASRITLWIKLHGLRKAQYLAGHRHIEATERYLGSEIEDLQKDLDTFHPIK